MKLYIFRTVPLSIIRSFSLYIQQWYMSYRFADSLQAGSGVSKPVWHIPLLCVYTVKNSWWWTEGLSETCRISFQNKIEKLVHLVGFIIRNNLKISLINLHNHNARCLSSRTEMRQVSIGLIKSLKLVWRKGLLRKKWCKIPNISQINKSTESLSIER